MREQTVPVSFTGNGAPYDLELPARRLLSDALRHDLRLTGTHVGCEHGVCGTCTVLIDGRTARSCLTLAVQADGADIRTVESLGTADALHPIQQAFWEKHGLQCGFCTPAMLLSALELLEAKPRPSREDIVEAIGGNLCRCTGYQNIIAAVAHAAELMTPAREAAE
jgi:aerobic carbon-monoxide dehydrogenase small subunit